MSEERFNYEVDDATRFVDNLKDRVHDLYDKNEELKEEVKRLNNIIKHTGSWIDRTIEIITQQPSEDDTWILERLNGIKQCLKGSESNE